MKKPQLNVLNNQVKKFNQECPVGTPVEYWTGLREGEGKKSKTRSKAELLGGHTPSVWIEGQSGCVSLSHVSILKSHV